jgi:hypothetical protein
MLTVGRIQCAFTLPLVHDRVPLTLQVLGLEIIPDGSLTPVRVQITLSDGMHCGSMTLARRLHSLATKVRCGAIMRLNNYISQVVKDNIVGVICLDATIVSEAKVIIGKPSNFVLLSDKSKPSIAFIGSAVDGFCSDCQMTPCDWTLLGPSIVDCVQSSKSCTTVSDCASTNKQCRFMPYQMFTRANLGYLGKHNRVPLPPCIVDGVRNNFPDPKDIYVGFIPTNTTD